MHGRVKVRTTEEQQLIKQKEQQQRLLAYRQGLKIIRATRHQDPYNIQSFSICGSILEKNPDVYTLWNYRKEVMEQKLSELNTDFSEDSTLYKKENQFNTKTIIPIFKILKEALQDTLTKDGVDSKLKLFMNIETTKELISSSLTVYQTKYNSEHDSKSYISTEESIQQFAHFSGVLCLIILYTLRNFKEMFSVELKELWKSLHSQLISQKVIHHDIAKKIEDIQGVLSYFATMDYDKVETWYENLGMLMENILSVFHWSVCYLMSRELDLTERCLLSNPKSYGAWHHRFWIMARHPEAKWGQELKVVEKYLKYDDRNFHTWDYRRLLLKKLGYELEKELQFSTDRINVNFSNYSSWHYRSTLRELNAETLEEELRLVQNAVFTDPYDSSTWFYLRWVLSNKAVSEKHREALLGDFEQLLQLEPDCKWIHMAKSWLKGSLSLSNKDEIKQNLDVYVKLMELDPMRIGMYLDYKKLGEDV